MSGRGWALALCVGLVGALGWSLLQVEWAPPRPTLACDDVFAGALTLEVPDDPRADFRVGGPLQPDRPAAVVQHQIIDANGFGWVNRSLPADAAGEHRTGLPRVPRTHTIRVGLLAPQEAQRARSVEAAARAFDLPAYRAALGWVAPAVTVCHTFEVTGP